MKYYLVAHIETKNMENMKIYREKVFKIVNKYKGKYLVRGGEMEVLEGKKLHDRSVIIEFPNKELAMKFYKSKEYKPLLELRVKSGISIAVIVEGA